MAEQRTPYKSASVFIPTALSGALEDYVCQCAWCDYDSRTRPVHHEKCPRYRPPLVGGD